MSPDLDSGREAFAHDAGVSRETMLRLDQFAHLLRKWNPAINIVAGSTLNTIWGRHFSDSAQAFFLAQAKGGVWADLGSGGGFPGLVVAILAAEFTPDLKITLVESDARKAAFLATVARECELDVRQITERIEAASPLCAQVISARALAPLPKLLEYAERHLDANGVAYFLKGATWRDEIDAARRNWRFDLTAHPSKTDHNSAVLEVRGVSRA